MSPDQAAVEAAIASVDDPCSIAARAPLGIFELGLVRHWNVDERGAVDVTISPTAPSCILIGSIVKAVEERVAAVDGVTAVRVQIDTTTVWTTGMMSGDGARKLERRRVRSLAGVPVRPRQWQLPDV